jgi:AcrR family transcriptional regulator
MSTSRRKNGTPTPERILRAAVSLFAAKGFDGTTTKQIAARARVNEALIFRHFPTKRKLYAAIIERKIAEESATRLSGLDMETADDEQVFRAVAEGLFDSFQKDMKFVRLLYFSALEGHQLSEMFFDTYVQRLNARLCEYARRRMSEKAFKPLDAFLVARAFLGMIAHHILVQELFPSKVTRPVPREKVIDTFVEVFLHGIRQ